MQSQRETRRISLTSSDRDPGFKVNMDQDGYGYTLLHFACSYGNDAVIPLLLAHPRVKVSEVDKRGNIPFWYAAHSGHLDVIRWWIASGREVDLGTPGDEETDAIWKATELGWTEVVTLLERFKENPENTRHAVRVELGLLDELAAEVIAPVVFVSDGLLQVKDTSPTPAARFFKICRTTPS